MSENMRAWVSPIYFRRKSYSYNHDQSKRNQNKNKKTQQTSSTKNKLHLKYVIHSLNSP